MKAKYINPPYTGQFIFSLESAFLQAATILAKGEQRLSEIYNAHDPLDPNSEWTMLHDQSRDIAMHTFNAMSEHQHACFKLEV